MGTLVAILKTLTHGAHGMSLFCTEPHSTFSGTYRYEAATSSPPSTNAVAQLDANSRSVYSQELVVAFIQHGTAIPDTGIGADVVHGDGNAAQGQDAMGMAVDKSRAGADDKGMNSGVGDGNGENVVGAAATGANAAQDHAS